MIKPSSNLSAYQNTNTAFQRKRMIHTMVNTMKHSHVQLIVTTKQTLKEKNNCNL
jgi:hypothetical protein